ncbi:hypothetical protein ACA910_010090 [Epithemia clementina (nom. ined.)]
MLLRLVSIPAARACTCSRRNFPQKYQDLDNVSTVKVLGQAKLDDKEKFVAWVKPEDEDWRWAQRGHLLSSLRHEDTQGSLPWSETIPMAQDKG